MYEVSGVFGNISSICNEKCLYHYTSGDALKSIVENKELWVTNAQYQNDELEREYALDLIDGIDKRLAKKHGASYQPINIRTTVVDRIDSMKESSFIISFSLSPDSYPLWMNYSNGDGYCIGFSPRVIHDTLESLKRENRSKCEDDVLSGIKIYAGKVIYAVRTQRRIVKDILESRHRDICDGYGELELLVKYAFTLELLVYLLKHPSYSCEDEFRIVFQLFTWNDKDFAYVIEPLKITHRMTDKTIAPKIKVRLNSEILPYAITNVLIGPKLKSDIAIPGVYSLLQSNGFRIFENCIKKSNIPLRY